MVERPPEFPIFIKCRMCGCTFNNLDEECPMCGWKIKYVGRIEHNP